MGVGCERFGGTGKPTFKKQRWIIILDREPAILLDKWLSCKSDKDALIVFLNHPSIKKLRDKAIAGKYKAGYKSDAQQIAYLYTLS